jgi:hypothetical protein
MIKLFNNIRQKLVAEGKTTNYLKYAIGEIVLVVVGILIALQINNWNENRKDIKLAKEYLSGIKVDLKKDVTLIDSLVHINANQISLINNIDSLFKEFVYDSKKYNELFIEPDTTLVKYIFYRGTSFRPIRATYNSLVADGKSNLIKNRELFEKIQEVYDELHIRIASVYETFKPSEDRLHWTYSFEKRYWNYSDLVASKDEKIFLDILNFVEIKYFYSQQMLDLKEKSNEVIKMISQELQN